MMKTRTRIFAWFAIVSWVIFLLVGIAALVSDSSRQEGEVFFAGEGARTLGQLRTFVGILLVPVVAFFAVGPVLGWIALLKERKWAWWLLVVVYAGWVLLGLRLAGNVALWGWGGVVLALFLGLPLPILLTDRPSGWTSDTGEAPGNSGPEIAPAPEKKQERRVGPLTLIEWFVILAILGILLAIIVPAVQRARLAARAAPAASAYETPREANDYLMPP